MDENWVLETSPWISYDLSSWDSLIRNLKAVPYKKKSFLFHQNDPAAFTYIVKSGRIRVTSFNVEGIEKQLYIAEAGCCIDIHFTHSDVASMVNTSRVTVSNIFTWLAENGYLHRQERFFVVDSVERLEELAQEGIDLEQYMKKQKKGS